MGGTNFQALSHYEAECSSLLKAFDTVQQRHLMVSPGFCNVWMEEMRDHV